jgi:hypothetical protein
MSKIETLADFLRSSDSEQSTDSGQSDALDSLSEVNPLELTGPEYAKRVLRSREFHYYVLNGLVMRDLPPAILVKLMDHGWGKPVEHVEVKDTTDHLNGLSVEQLEARALFLADSARKLLSEREDEQEEKKNVTH